MDSIYWNSMCFFLEISLDCVFLVFVLALQGQIRLFFNGIIVSQRGQMQYVILRTTGKETNIVKIIHEADELRLPEAALCTLLSPGSSINRWSLTLHLLRKVIPPQHIHTLSIFFECFYFNSVYICMRCYKKKIFKHWFFLSQLLSSHW